MPYLWRFLFISIVWCSASVSHTTEAGVHSPTDSLSSGNYTRDTARARAWMRLSNKTLSSDKNLSFRYADSSFRLYRELGNKNGMGDALVRMGLAQNAMGECKSAISNYEQALSLFKQIKNENKAAKVLNNIGVCQMQLGRHTDAITNYLASLELRRRENDSVGMAATYTNIAIVFAIKNDLKQAEKYFNAAIQIYRRIRDEANLNKNLLNLAGIYKDRTEYRKSIEMVRKVQSYYARQKDKGELGRCFYIIGSNFEALKQYDSAYDYFTRALKIYTESDNKSQVAGTKLKLAGIANKKKDFSAAIDQSEAALELARSMNARETELRSYLELSKSYENLGDFEKAYEYYKKYTVLKDTIFSIESAHKVMELEAQYQDKIKQQEINSLKAEKLISDLEIKRKNNFTGFLIGILFLLILVIFLVYNQYRINRRNNLELQQKNRIIENSLTEKEVLLREIHHRVKNNLQFIWSLFNLQARHVKDKEALRTLTEGKNRVKTMALIHQKLYQTENITGIDMVEYVPSLISNIFETYHVHQDTISLHTEIDPMVLDIDIAMPLGLIINELVTNSLKHAFDDINSAQIDLSLKREDEAIVLQVKDNGKGFAVETQDEKSFGLKLVHSLARQLKADLSMTGESGASAIIRIPQKQSVHG